MNISQAQAKFLASKILNSLGTANIPDGELPVVEEIMKMFGGAFIVEAQSNLRKNKSIASGAINDIRIQQTKFGNTYVLSLGYPENKPASKYFEYVNKGVKGTKNEKADSKTQFKFNPSKKSIPVSVIEGWLGYNKLKAVSVKRYSKLGVELKAIDSKKSLAYLVARSIHRKGLRSTHYFDEALTSTFGSNFTNVILAALGEDINIKIQATNKQNNGNNNTK
jgi:hypothetical protein